MPASQHPFAALMQEYVAECLPLAEEVVERALDLERRFESGGAIEAALSGTKGTLHTLKGNSAMMGLTAHQAVAHVLEDVVGQLVGQPEARAELVEALVRGAGMLGDMVRAAADPELDTARGEAFVLEARRLLAQEGRATPVFPESKEERRQSDRRTGREGGELGADGSIATIRLDSRRLDALLETFGEAMIAHAGLRESLRELRAWRKTVAPVAAVEHAAHAIEMTLRRLETALMETRLLPISTVLGRYARLVRDLAQGEGKRARIEVAGGDTRLDKTVLDRLGEPLVHLVTNAVIHGLEPPGQREKAGKAAEAVITLRAAQRGNRVLLTVSDDGRGLNPERILTKARALGLVAEGDTPPREEVFALAFLPGLSTTDQVSALSGRGVGLDVVANSIRALGGSVAVTSEAGRGTTFSLQLPLTVAVLRSLLVEVNAERYALALADVAETIRLDPDAVHELADRGMTLWRGAVIPVVDGGDLLGAVGAPGARRYCVVLRTGARHRGLLVDTLLGHQDVVVKALDPALGRPPAVSGATILGDGRVACILDTVRIAESRDGADLEPAGK